MTVPLEGMLMAYGQIHFYELMTFRDIPSSYTSICSPDFVTLISK